MVKLNIDGIEIEVNKNITVIQACAIAGVEIPRFCYHEKLAVAGNCRMCLVEMEKSPKPIASCAMPVAEGMVIHTNTQAVKAARQGVMEFLLINHPLDCPICDQGGECDLQDQAMLYGKSNSRFDECKRSVEDKYIGPLIKTHMNRCIHCTRCVRFSTQIAGTEEIGAIGRGENMEIMTYLESAISSELSGNMIDLCPVGALTSKPFAYKARTWELRSTKSIDILDAVGSNIRIDSKPFEVMRILPRINDDINEEWISDKIRFSYDGLKLQRLDKPMIRRNGQLSVASWDDAMRLVASKIKSTIPSKIAAIAGDLTDAETMICLKKLLNIIGSDRCEIRTDGMKIGNNRRSDYIFNTEIKNIDKSDLCLLIGANPRYEATIINARLRKRYLSGKLTIANIGEKLNLTYQVRELGNDISILNSILSGDHEFSEEIKNSTNPMIIIGISVLNIKQTDDIIKIIKQICKKYNVIKENWNGFNKLHRSASRVAGLDIGFICDHKNIDSMIDDSELLYLLGFDEIDPDKLANKFVIYQGHHGDIGASNADVIFPGAAFTEKNSTYINTEGKLQKTNMAIYPPGDAKDDWMIIKELSKYLKINLDYKNITDIRNDINNQIIKKNDSYIDETDKEIRLSSYMIEYNEFNYYMTDLISKSSKTMAECSSIFNKGKAA